MSKKQMRLLFPLLILMVFAAHLFILYFFTNVGWENTYSDAILNTLILSLAVWGVLIVIGSYPIRVAYTLYALLVASFFSVLAGYLDWQVLRLALGKDDATYFKWLTDTMPMRYIVNWLICGWVATYISLLKLNATIEDKFKQQADVTMLLRDAELYKLRQQLQPHFLYNSLNSISALTMIEPEKAQEMIGKLSDFLRSSVKREAQDRIPIAEELAYIEAYLSIEAIRFGDRLNVVFEKEYTDDAQIPPFLLQPVLENAIKFGLYGKTGNVTINVHIALLSSALEITISNPYDVASQAPSGTGFGLEGIRRRLYLLYARTDLLETQRTEERFTTILKIPQNV